MICPKCGSEMLEGYLPTNRTPIRFYSKDENKLAESTDSMGRLFSKCYIPLTKFPFAKQHRAEAYYCRHCKFIIAPVKDIY